MTHDNVLDSTDAVLVIDMQNSFLHPDGAMYHYRGDKLVEADRTIARAAEVVAAAAARGVPVVYARHCYRPGYPDANDSIRGLFQAMGAEPLLRGSWDAAIVEELSPGPGAVIVDKTRFDCFHGTDLDVLLRGIGTRLILTGIVTNVCVETTARGAAMRDLDVTILADCCTAYTAEYHANTLNSLEYCMIARVETWSGDKADRP